MQPMSASSEIHKITIDQTPKFTLNEDNKLVFKCNHYISKGNRNIETIRRDFIDQIILKLNERFPKEDSNIVQSSLT
jgi:hypothetical protein